MEYTANTGKTDALMCVTMHGHDAGFLLNKGRCRERLSQTCDLKVLVKLKPGSTVWISILSMKDCRC